MGGERYVRAPPSTTSPEPFHTSFSIVGEMDMSAKAAYASSSDVHTTVLPFCISCLSA